MMKGKVLERAIVLVDEAPEWMRPLIAGPVIIAAWMTANGALIVGPILVLLLLWFSDDRWQALLDGSRILMLIFGSSALGGLLYTLLGKPLKSILPFGWIPAGWVAGLPYMLAWVLVLRIADGEPMMTPLEGRDWLVVSFLTLIFGSQLGYLFLRTDADSR